MTLDPALVEKAMDAFCASESAWLKVCISNALSAVIPDIRAAAYSQRLHDAEARALAAERREKALREALLLWHQAFAEGRSEALLDARDATRAALTKGEKS